MSIIQPFATESACSPGPHRRRRNAEKSTGPRTEEGRQRSKLNACRHQLTGQITVMTEKDGVMFDLFVTGILDDRAAAIEDNLYARGVAHRGGEECGSHPEIDDAFTHAKVFTVEAKRLQLLTLYETRIHRNVQKTLATLPAMQEKRLAREEVEMEEAKVLLQDSEIRQIPYDPAKDGFVFSKAKIYSAIERQRRLERARKTNFKGFKPRTMAA
jgi:hypothetical protein